MYIYDDIMITQNDIGAVDSRIESLSCKLAEPMTIEFGIC